jgi:hypothetical protein
VLGAVTQLSLPGLYKKPAYGSSVGGGGAGVGDLTGVGIRVETGRGAGLGVGVAGNGTIGGGMSVGGSVGGAAVKVGRTVARAGVRVEFASTCAISLATRQPRTTSQAMPPRAKSVSVEGNLFNLTPKG